jgi:hypothetical protein
MGNQFVTVECYPLPSIVTRMDSKPLHLTLTIWHRHGLDAPVSGWFGCLSGLLLF